MRLIYNKKEKNIPENAVYVGRGSKWGNPYKIGEHAGNVRATREMVIGTYKLYLDAKLKLHPELKGEMLALKGKPLVCHCYPADCHARIMLEKIEELYIETSDNKKNTI